MDLTAEALQFGVSEDLPSSRNCSVCHFEARFLRREISYGMVWRFLATLEMTAGLSSYKFAGKKVGRMQEGDDIQPSVFTVDTFK